MTLTAAQHEAALLGLVGSGDVGDQPSLPAYACGERRADRGDADAAPHLEAAIAAAESVDSAFVAGVARHTLLTSSARTDRPGRGVAGRFGPLLDFWHGFGAWTQRWIAARALSRDLVPARPARRRGGAARRAAGEPPRQRAVRRRLGACARVEAAARAALGPAFAPLYAEGRALGDTGAVALARRLVRAGATAQVRADRRAAGSPGWRACYPAECDHPVARFPIASGR